MKYYRKFYTQSDATAVWSEAKSNVNKPKKLADFITPKVINASLNNSRIKQMQQEARNVMKQTLNDVYSQAKSVLSITSLQDLQKVIDVPIKEMEQIKKLPLEQRKVIEKKTLDTIKMSIKEMYIQNLSEQVKSAIETGIPEDSQFVNDYKKLISSIKVL